MNLNLNLNLDDSRTRVMYRTANNYRGIKLMSHSMKVWEKVIDRRMREECVITQNQFGFVPGRGTSDAIFALRQLCVKYRHAHKSLHLVFVDLEKAYDRVPREVLWWALKEKGVPGKYVRLVNAMYAGARTNVRSEAGVTGEFNVAVGLHQGSALCPLLFLLVMDALTSNIQEEAPWCMLFADDIVLVGEKAAEVQSRLGKWQEMLERVGLKISRTKTEHLFCNFSGSASFSRIAIDTLTVYSDFKYLGSLLQNDGNLGFVDFNKAFDSLEHKYIWEALEKQGVQTKFIRILKNIYCNSTAQIKLETAGKEFPIERGVRQGDPISPKLFTAVLEQIYRNLDWSQYGLNIDGESLSHLKFADDLVLFSENSHELQIMLQQLSDESDKAFL